MQRSLVALTVLVLAACEPMGPIPGGALSGEVATAPVDDWTRLGEAETIFVETRIDDPHSVTTWCVAHERKLYVPTRKPDKKHWVQNLIADSRVRLKIGNRIYERRATRVLDQAEFEAVAAKLIAKYEIEDDDVGDVSEVWFFRIEPR